MPSLRDRFLRALVPIEWVAARTCQAAAVIMTAVVMTQVVLRYVFRSPLVWAEEASVFLMIWISFVGSGLAIRDGAHIAMNLLYERLPPLWSRVVLAASCLAILAFLGVLFWQGVRLALFVGDQPSPALRIPMTWPYLIMPVGAAFMVLEIVAALADPKGRPLSRSETG
jgi:TRAP-type C4-dicarboxylate transport system permease small subunit